MVASLEENVRKLSPVSAPPEQRSAVEALSRALVEGTGDAGHNDPRYKLVGPNARETLIPESVFRVLEQIVEVMARGDAITVVPVGKQLTTQQAAGILNVSRQYVVRLLDSGRIPFTRTGRHRRVLVEDVLTFKRARDRRRRSALDRLTQLSEDFGGYGEISQGPPES